MPDTDDGEIEPGNREEIEDSDGTGPLLSFDFDESAMPHWSEPGSGERPDGGERPDPPELEDSRLGGSRLFPQLPDDPHLVDTSDTGLMDAVRSDTIPTVSLEAQEGQTSSEFGEMEHENRDVGDEEPDNQVSDDGDFLHPQISTDELFGEPLFDDTENFDEIIVDDSAIIGRVLVGEDEAPAYDTGPIGEIVGQVPEAEVSDPIEVDSEQASDEVVGDGHASNQVDSTESMGNPDEPIVLDEQELEVESVLENEPTAELVLDEEELSPIEVGEDGEESSSEHDGDFDLGNESEPNSDPERPERRVIKLFDTPPSQRIMRAEASANEEESGDNEDAEWNEFGGPAPHWREGRRDYEESTKVNEEDRTVTHGSVTGEESAGSSESTGRNLPAAIGVGLALAAAFFGLLKVGPWAMLIMVLAALGFAALEFFTSAQNLGYRPATLLGLAAVVGLSFAAYHRGFEAYPVVFALLVITGMCWFLFDVDSQHVTANFAVTLLGFAWVGGLGSFAALILARPNGDAILIGAVIGTIAYDVGGYVIGSTTGQSKIAPRVSPNKTYEGLLGGMMLSVVVTTLVLNRFPGVHPWSVSMMDCFWLGLAIALVAPVGDLAQSMIKRDMGVKDMGSLLPGHGGVFDRFDALLFVLPTAYFVADLVLT